MEEGTLRWEFVRFTEPSRVIGVRVVDMPLKSGNDIAQVTVRFKYMQVYRLKNIPVRVFLSLATFDDANPAKKKPLINVEKAKKVTFP